MAAPATLARALRRALDVEDLPPLEAMRPRGPIPLLNPRRLEILLTAAAYPGIHLRSAARLLLSSLPTLRFHVARLEARGALRTVHVDRRTCLFVPKLFRPASERLLARWADPVDRKLLDEVRSGRSRTRVSLLAGSGLRKGAVDRSIRRLREAGAVRVRSARRGVAVSLAPPWGRLERECADGAEERLRRFVDLLAREGLRPTVDRGEGSRARLSVDGPRGRIRFALPLDPLSPRDQASR